MRTREPLDGGRVRLGLQFIDDDPVGRARLALWAFRNRPEVAEGAGQRSVQRRRRARAA